MKSPTGDPAPEPDTEAGWQRRWRSLIPSDPRLGDELVSRYADEARRYHDLDHLLAVLHAVDLLAAEAHDLAAVRLAAWFHDAVYDVHRDDNEARSAELAAARLAAAGVEADVVTEVARLVRLTRTHDPAPGDADGMVLCDADLAVLAGSVADYRSYAAKVRQEYAHVPDADFRTGRAAVLEQLAALPALYSTAYGRTHWEERARANLRAELDALRA